MPQWSPISATPETRDAGGFALKNGNVVDAEEATENGRLTYVSVEDPGIQRRKAGKGFS
jgi:DNA topoisomerase IB